MSLYVVGKIIGCFGVRGHLKVQPSSSSAERLAALDSVEVGNDERNVKAYDIATVEARKQNVVLHFKEVTTRTEAEHLVGMYLFVEEERVAPPKEGSYFTHDIIGCDVYAEDRRHLGTIVEVYKMPAQDLWVLQREGKRHSIPAVKEFVKSVDIKSRVIVIHVIEGLLDE